MCCLPLLVIITGGLSAIAIEGHALTAGKNLEQQTLAFLVLDSVEETMLAAGSDGSISVRREHWRGSTTWFGLLNPVHGWLC